MNTPLPLNGKQVFVFGGSSGNNLGIVAEFTTAGAQVGVDNRGKDMVDEVTAKALATIAAGRLWIGRGHSASSSR